MKEDNKDILPQMDSRSAKNLREAIRQEEMACPPMPSDLNARLMNRVGKEVNMVKPKKSARIILPWMAAACVAGVFAIFLMPPKVTQQVPQLSKGELLIAHVVEDSIKQNEEVIGKEKTQPLIADVEHKAPKKKYTKINQVAKVENVEKEPLLAEATSIPTKEAEDFFDVTLADVRRATSEKMMSCDMDCMNENIKYRGNRLAALINEQ